MPRPLLRGTYTAPADRLTITATLPEAAALDWWGAPGTFYVTSACARDASISITAMTATDVLVSSCMPENLEFATFEQAIARLDTPTGDDISGRADLTIDGYRAARYDVSAITTCPEGFGLWAGTTLGGGETGSIYVIDVDGVLLAVVLNRSGRQTPAELEEAHAIIESFDIEP